MRYYLGDLLDAPPLLIFLLVNALTPQALSLHAVAEYKVVAPLFLFLTQSNVFLFRPAAAALPVRSQPLLQYLSNPMLCPRDAILLDLIPRPPVCGSPEIPHRQIRHHLRIRQPTRDPDDEARQTLR
jgi:hypothetical protein